MMCNQHVITLIKEAHTHFALSMLKFLKPRTDRKGCSTIHVASICRMITMLVKGKICVCTMIV